MSATRSRPAKRSKPAGYRVIGTRPVRPDDAAKVTGQAVFGEDVRLSGMLYGAILRSPHAHARIVAIDTRAAEALPGVEAVVTSADLPALPEPEGVVERDNVLAREKVLYVGHAVAAVAARNPHVAEDALARIHVTYDVLPHVLDVRQAMAPGAPILHPGLRTDDNAGASDQPTNIATHLLVKRGSLERGLRQAAVTVEREFQTSAVHQGYLEPQSAAAQFAPSGRLTVLVRESRDRLLLVEPSGI